MSEDWDESSIRAASADDAERYMEEVRPGQSDEEESPAAEANAEPAAASPVQQVVLKIRRRKFKRTFKAGEIAVTRRLFRTGESEYLLNGKLCRLRDIQDLFMGTGLGPESYAIIEQGRIGQILSSKPTDRRAIIEEAAGITKFKTRKRLAEARLEDAKQNLSRINDIFDEVTRQMNSLKRQASKAERYAKLRDEMRAKLRVVLTSKFAQLESEAASLESQLTALGEEMRAKLETSQQMESEHSELTQRGYTVERDAQTNREQLNTLAMELDRATARRRTNEERCAELQARSAGAQAEITTNEAQLSQLEQELEANRATLQSANADVDGAQTELQQRQADAAAASANLMQLEAQQEQRRSQILQAVSQGSSVRNRITQAEERLAALERDAHRLNSEVAAANQQLETFGGQRGQLGLEFETATQLVSELDGRITGTRQKLDELRAAETDGKRHLDGMRSEFAGLMGRRGSLEAVIAEHGYSTESVRRLFKSGALNGGHAPAGVLADFLEVEDRYEHVVEDFLRDELNYIVVKSWDAADEGLRLLRSDVDGRATFLVHPEDSQAKFSFVHDEVSYGGPRRDSVVPMKDCIRVLNGFGKSLEVMLPKLGNGYIVPDPNVGRELALENPDAFFLSQSGECFHNVTVTGGKQRSEGPLSMKRDLRDVLKQMDELEAAIRDKELRVAAVGREIGELGGLLQRLEDEKRDAERQAMTSGHTLNQLSGEMTRVRDRLTTYEGELQRLSSERIEREAFVASHTAELEQLEQKQRALEDELQAAQSSFEGLRQRRDESVQLATEARAQLATLEERRRGAIANVQRLESMTTEAAGRVAKLRGQIDSAAAEMQQRESENIRLAEQVVVWEAEREAAQQTRPGNRAGVATGSCPARSTGRGAEDGARRARRCSRSSRRTGCRAGPAALRHAALVRDLRAGAEHAARRVDERRLGRADYRRAVNRRRRSLQRDAHAPGEHGAGQHDGPRGVSGDGAAPRIPRHPAQRPAGLDREHAKHHQGNRNRIATEIRRGVCRDQRKLQPDVQSSCSAVGRRSCGSPIRKIQPKADSTSWLRLRARSCKMCCCFPAARRH